MDVYASITELTAVYEKLNESLKSDPCTANAYQIYRQEAYRDAYATLCTVSVEQIALHIIAEGKEDRMLARLRDLIRENIHICETRRNISSCMDFDALYQLQEEYLFAKRRTALLNDKKLIEEYLTLRNASVNSYCRKTVRILLNSTTSAAATGRKTSHGYARTITRPSAK